MSRIIKLRNLTELETKEAEDKASVVLNLPILRENDVVILQKKTNNTVSLKTMESVNSVDFNVIEGNMDNFNEGNFSIKEIDICHDDKTQYEILLQPTKKKPTITSKTPSFVKVRNHNSIIKNNIQAIMDLLESTYKYCLDLLFNPDAVSVIGFPRENHIKNASIICSNLWKLNGILLVDPVKMEYLRLLDKNEDAESVKGDHPTDNEWEKLSESLGMFTELDKEHAKYINENILLGESLSKGNWIFICPENIKSFSDNLLSCLNFKYRGKYYTYFGKSNEKMLDQFVLKKVLLHELGHLVFRKSNETTDKEILNETRANWFSSILMNESERYLLRIITALQPYRYQKLLPIPSINFSSWKEDNNGFSSKFLDYIYDVNMLFNCDGQMLFEYEYDY